MSRTVFCEYLNKEAPGLDFQLYPGDLGKKIFNSISKEAFALWQAKQPFLVAKSLLAKAKLEHAANNTRAKY